jgi:hypothetical protein
VKTGTLLVGAELGIVVLSGLFAIMNHTFSGPAAVTVIFAVLAIAAALATAVMAGLLWLFNLPTDQFGDSEADDTPEFGLAA